MKIHTLNPSGCHKREIKALTALAAALPSDWFAYASLEMVGNDGGEIDLVICARDRLIAVEIKDWDYPITDFGQTWETAGRSEKSPVISIREKSKFLAGRLGKHLAQKAYTPWVESCVILSGRATRAALSNESKEKTFELEYFLKLGSPSKFLEAFPQKGNRDTSKHELNTSTQITDLKSELSFFFNGKRNFRGASRRYNEFKAEEDYCFQHPQKIYEEFFAKKPGVKGSNALLRVWDFDNLADIDGAYREESNRKQLALREENTIGYLKEKNPVLALEHAFLSPISNEGRGTVTNRFFELYDLPFSMKRLREASNQYRDKLKLQDRLSMATMLIRRVAELHELGVAHRDLGDHCVWVEVPRRIAISGFATAHVPEEKTVSQIRTSVKANSSILPEDLMGITSNHFRKDVFLLAVAIHQILFGEKPQLDDRVSHWVNRESTEGVSLNSWFESALDWEPANRFKDAGAALKAFNESIEIEPQKVVSQKHFEEFQRERMIFPDPGKDTFLTKTQQLLHFKTPTDEGHRQIKLWTSARYQEGNEEQNLHLLQFLERCLAIQKHSFPGLQEVIDFGLTGMGCYVELEWVEGDTLEDVDLSAIDDETLSDIVVKLVESVWDIHTRDIYHGDIKASNILISKSKAAEYSVKLLDSLDFSPLGTERLSPAYSPPEGEDVAIPARDGFALRKTIIELLKREYSEIEKGVLERLEDCSRPLYSPDVFNPDFEGVLTALAEMTDEVPEVEAKEVTAYSRFFSENSTLSGDERGLPIEFSKSRENPSDCFINIYTPDKILRIIAVIATGKVVRAFLSDSSMGQFAAAMKHNSGRYHGVIHLIKSDAINLSELEKLHADVVVEQDTPRSAKSSNENDLPKALHSSETENENLKSAVNVPVLWQSILDAEEEIIPTVEVVEENKKHNTFGEYQLVVSNASFSSDTYDWLDVELETQIRGEWKFIGKMNLNRSEVGKADLGKLVFKNTMPTFFPPRKGSRIRLQDKRAKMSYERRKKAAERVIQGRGTSRSLMEIFSGNIEAVTTSSEFGEDTEIPSSYELNRPQRAALLNSLNKSPLSLIQGPPGTGKTRVIAAAVHFIVTQKPSSKILVVSQSHEAVNNATDQIVKLFASEKQEPSLVRVGRRSSLSDDLISYHSETIQATYRNFFKERLAERIAPVGKELGLPADFVEELTIVRARLAPLMDELERLQKDPNEAEGSTLKRIQKRIVEVCEQHAAGPHFDESQPEKAYEELEVVLAERYSVANMALLRNGT
jgi:serine/threonine protein kinase